MKPSQSAKFDVTSPEKSSETRSHAVDERRYAVRYAFTATAEARDLDNGARSSGPLTDLSSSGCFVATSEPLPVRSRVSLRVTHGKETIEVLATVRAIKHGSGMGLEFLDIEAPYFSILQTWLARFRA